MLVIDDLLKGRIRPSLFDNGIIKIRHFRVGRMLPKK